MEHTIDAPATSGERAAIDTVLGAGAPAGDRRDLLLPALHALQSRAGWISRGGLGYVCERLSVAPADAYGVASFYGLFSLEPAPPRVVHVCTDLVCKVNGADEI